MIDDVRGLPPRITVGVQTETAREEAQALNSHTQPIHAINNDGNPNEGCTIQSREEEDKDVQLLWISPTPSENEDGQTVDVSTGGLKISNTISDDEDDPDPPIPDLPIQVPPILSPPITPGFPMHEPLAFGPRQPELSLATEIPSGDEPHQTEALPSAAVLDNKGDSYTVTCSEVEWIIPDFLKVQSESMDEDRLFSPIHFLKVQSESMGEDKLFSPTEANSHRFRIMLYPRSFSVFVGLLLGEGIADDWTSVPFLFELKVMNWKDIELPICLSKRICPGQNRKACSWPDVSTGRFLGAQ
eukprot:GHVO01011786.1.p1 GENE.GHVO01011786.1~~GHVO01011786.1.p1  ORF type:complete len:300 (+),score=37.36 GHVO01011786.1:139-1038(+)